MGRANVPRAVAYDKARFRITTWPPDPLPHPRQGIRLPYRVTPGGGLAARPLEEGDVTWSGTSSETYLLALALDLTDTAAIAEFVSTHGVMGIAMRGYNQFFKLGWGFEENVLPRLRTSRDRCREMALVEAGFDEDFPSSLDETVTEFRYAVAWLRDLTTAWRVLRGELDVTKAQWAGLAWGEGRPNNPYGLGNFLRIGLPRGLAWIHPEVVVEETSPALEIGRLDFFAFDICCLELFNHIAERAYYRRCANETCGRLFVRQEGRAVHGQHRTRGVKYCSPECARAQAQRAYRRRRAQSGDDSASSADPRG